MRIRKLAAEFFGILALALVTPFSAQAITFEEEFPNLKKFVFSENKSNIFFGIGISPLGIVKNKAGFGLSIFQIHYIKGNLDWEMVNASFMSTASDVAETNFKSFTFRTAPKFKLFRILSAGPLLGIEFVNYPDISAKIGNGTFFTKPEPFSSRGLIYGAALSETFNIGKYTIKANQLLYKQNYSTTEAFVDGWNYYYEGRADLNLDPTPIAGGWVFMLEFSFLY
jgi:hypothetical protein